METVKVTQVNQKDEYIFFDNGVKLYSSHDQDCCEHHWLDFKHLTEEDFKGLEFDLSGETFFKRIYGYGIELVPVNGWSVKIPGYGSNNGYYSTNLTLCLSGNGVEKSFDITECQEIND